MEKNPIKRFFEITLIILIVFGIIALVFLGFNYGFKFLRTISANVVSENISTNSGVLDWFITLALTSFVVFYIIKFLVRKNFLKMKSGQVSEVEVDY